MTTVLITRPRMQAGAFGEALQEAGFEPVYFPVIAIEPIAHNPALERAMHSLEAYDWVVFTSVNAVHVFFERLTQPFPSAQLRVAAIGPKTAQALQIHGICPAFVPDEYVAEAVLPGLGDLRRRRVLLPRAEIARKALPDAITAAGGQADEIAIYRTLPAPTDAAGLAALRRGVDAVTLTSPSTVHHFIAAAQQNGLDGLNLPGRPTFACIGPITRQAAEAAHLAPLIFAQEYTTEGIVRALQTTFER